METMDMWIKDDEETIQSELEQIEQIPISLQIDVISAARDCNSNNGSMSPLLTCTDSRPEQPSLPSIPISLPPSIPISLPPSLPPSPIQQQKPEDFLKLSIGSGPKKRYIFGRNGIYLESETGKDEGTRNEEPKAKKLKLLGELLNSGPQKKSLQHIVQKPKNINKSKWTLEEDEQLKQIMASYSSTTSFSFSRVCSSMPTRTAKQCRERWHNQLSPDVRKDKWTKEEDETIIKCWKEFGPLWSRMALLLKGRTDNAIKNHFNCSLKKETVLSSPFFTKIKL
jgi:hypothetical protein